MTASNPRGDKEDPNRDAPLSLQFTFWCFHVGMQGLFMLYIVQRVLPKQFKLSLISTQKIFQVQYSMKELCGNLRCAVMFFFKQLALLRSAKDTVQSFRLICIRQIHKVEQRC